ncbi:hypothetical protein PO909_007301, partial [Leuciscus waleckii]
DVSVRNDAKTCSNVIDQSASGALPRLRSAPSPPTQPIRTVSASTVEASAFFPPLLLNFLPTSPISCSMGSSLNML